MNIVISSGKGGAGKTTVAVALALAADRKVVLVDCDAEEPNSHLFFKPSPAVSSPVERMLPRIDASECNYCGKCAEFCGFNAISAVRGSLPILFEDLCHSCGGCAIVCPQHAIREEAAVIGSIERRVISDSIDLITSRLKVGQSLVTPVIHAAFDYIPPGSELVIVDGPPGVSCPFVATMAHADFTLFVTEPTPFGLHDLKIAVEATRKTGVPFGVLINKSDADENMVSRYLIEEEIILLGQIPLSRKIAEGYSSGKTLIDSLPSIKETLKGVLDQAIQLAKKRGKR
jgi:MinD superfamily P-loop ATPase